MPEEDLTVAAVHYHARPGGVTSVIRDTQRALNETGKPIRLLQITGEAPIGAQSKIPTLVIPNLSYPSESGSFTLEQWAEDAFQSVLSALHGREPDIWHFHNHALGKNTTMLYWVNWLHHKGKKLLLQIHDFAEDHRGSNFHFRETSRSADCIPYPVGRNVRYAVLNQRDKKALEAAGCEPGRVTYLPNPIPGSDNAIVTETQMGKDASFFLYPVRALPRKNLGELLLLASHAPTSWRWATTLGASRPEHKPMVDAWQALAQKYKHSVNYGIVEKGLCTFKDAYKQSSAIVGTSIQEGFGLGFLEPWLRGKPYVGRDLPQISEDFNSVGIKFPNCYASIKVPGEWVDKEQLSIELQLMAAEYRTSYGFFSEAEWAGRLRSKLEVEQGFDFGMLPYRLQYKCLERMLRTGERLDELSQWVRTLQFEDCELLRKNKELIIECFGSEAFAAKLTTAYRSFEETLLPGEDEEIDPEKLIAFFN